MWVWNRLLACCAKLLVAASVYVVFGSVAQAGTIVSLADGTCSPDMVDGKEYRSYDGSCNNKANPTWGSAGIELQRYPGSNYDAPATDLPSTRAVSNAVSDQSASRPNSKGLSAMIMQWGQFLDHDIDLTPVTAEHWNIPIETTDPVFGDVYGGDKGGMPFERSLTASANQQVNAITSFIDASQLYGSSLEEANGLRARQDGMLKMDGNLLPRDEVTGEFFSGDERAREQVGLTSMHTLFSREHNRIAMGLAAQYRMDNPAPSGTGVTAADIEAYEAALDETVYQETRKVVGAMMQRITFYEFLPALLGEHAPAPYDLAGPNGTPLAYDPTVNPTIFNAFSTAAYRFGHSTLNEDLLRLDENLEPLADPLPLARAFFVAEYLIDPAMGGMGIEPFLRGLATQRAQEVDTLVVDALRNLLFRTDEVIGFDLPALNMQRGRDHGLPSYNEMRGLLGLETYSGWDDADLTFDPDFILALSGIYPSFDDLDLWIGGLAEQHLDDSLLGELFTTLIAEQFSNLRVGDRFWFEHDGMFEDFWMDFIEASTLSTIMLRNGVTGLQANVFFVVPAPGVLLLLAAGLVGMRLQRRRARD